MSNPKFIPQRKNANKHTLHGTRLLEKSITQDGFIDAQTAAADGEIISGSARLELSAEKFSDVEPIVVHSDGKRPVIVIRDDIPNASDPRAKRLSVAANQIAKTDWNPDGELLKEWGGEDDAIRKMFADSEWVEVTGEKKPAIDAEPQINRAAELLEKWQVKTGDLWQIGEHRLLCGDCTDEVVLRQLMGNEKATLLFTDPPYGVSIGAKNRMLNSYQKAGRNLTDIESDQENAEDLGKMLLAAFTLIKKFLADDCSVFVCSPQGGSLMMMMMMMMMNAGLEVRHVLNWVKNSPTFSMGRLDYEYQHEPMLFTWVKTHKKYKRGFTTSTWNVDKPRASADHPTMKPVELPANALLNHTDEGDVCIDNFGGSGTTMVACENLKRKCRMAELTPNFCAVILERMSTAFPHLEIKRLE